MAGGTMQVQRTKTETVTASQSLALCKNLLRVGLSQVVYIRGLFTEKCFEPKEYCELRIQQLTPNTPESKLLIAWLEKGVFDALHRGYLRALIFAISVPDTASRKRVKPMKVIETYQWKVEYDTQGGVSLNGERVGTSKEQLKAQAIKLIRALVCFSETLETLPEERVLSMQITYNDTCPKDWEPAYFRAAADSDRIQLDAAGSIRVKIGSVVTPQYSLELKFVGLPDSTGAVQEASPALFATRGGESLLHGATGPAPAAAAPMHGGKTPAPTPASPFAASPPAPAAPTVPKPAQEQQQKLTPAKATGLSSLSLEDKEATATAAPATVKQERGGRVGGVKGGDAGSEAAGSGAVAAVVSTVVGVAEHEAVKRLIRRRFQVGAYIPTAATAKALGLPRDKLEAALKRLVREGVLEKKPWGAVSRFLVRSLPKVQQEEQGATAAAAEEEDKMAVEGEGEEEQTPTAGHRTPTDGANTPPAHLLRGGAADSDEEETVAGTPSPPGKAKPKQPKPGSRLASEYLLEQGSGFDISLSQDSTTAAPGRKCSVVQDPIKQVFKRARK